MVSAPWGVIIHQQGAAILEHDGINATVGIGQLSGFHGRPLLPVALGPTFGNYPLLCPVEKLNPAIGPLENGGLNGPKFLFMQGARALPGKPEIARAFQMNHPAMLLGARTADNRPILP